MGLSRQLAMKIISPLATSLALVALITPGLSLADSLNGKTLTVTAVPHEPWLKLKDDSSNRVGNDRYEGYLIDLIAALGQKLGANFDVHIAADGRYGAPTDSGAWTGMVGEVMTGKADLALADLTITSKREKVVDFTVPYMQTGITILFSQPSWGLRTFKSIEDLIKQDISFSCVEGGATERFFKNSKIPEYNQAWNMMNDFDLMTKNNNEGIERFLENPGEFAFLVESKSADYAMAKHCGLSTVGGNINMRNYGIAVKQGSSYRETLNVALLELMEEGVVSSLENKWWKGQAKTQKCDLMGKLLSSFSDIF